MNSKEFKEYMQQSSKIGKMIFQRFVKYKWNEGQPIDFFCRMLSYYLSQSDQDNFDIVFDKIKKYIQEYRIRNQDE
jgi:hypothetical protein